MLNTLISYGHERHFAVCHGNVSSELIEFSAWTDMELLENIPYAKHIQNFKPYKKKGGRDA